MKLFLEKTLYDAQFQVWSEVVSHSPSLVSMSSDLIMFFRALAHIKDGCKIELVMEKIGQIMFKGDLRERK